MKYSWELHFMHKSFSSLKVCNFALISFGCWFFILYILLIFNSESCGCGWSRETPWKDGRPRFVISLIKMCLNLVWKRFVEMETVKNLVWIMIVNLWPHRSREGMVTEDIASTCDEAQEKEEAQHSEKETGTESCMSLSTLFLLPLKTFFLSKVAYICFWHFKQFVLLKGPFLSSLFFDSQTRYILQLLRDAFSKIYAIDTRYIVQLL